MNSKFLKDYVKVMRTITSVETREQMKTARKLFSLLVKKWEKHADIIDSYDESIENLFMLVDSKTNLLYTI